MKPKLLEQKFQLFLQDLCALIVTESFPSCKTSCGKVVRMPEEAH